MFPSFLKELGLSQKRSHPDAEPSSWHRGGGGGPLRCRGSQTCERHMVGNRSDGPLRERSHLVWAGADFSCVLGAK